MTFDDGILKIYTVQNTAANGNKPVKGLVLKQKFYFGFDVLGYNRYYTALQAKEQIEFVVNIPGWEELDPLDVVVLEDGKPYRMSLIQPMHDDMGLRITKLSLVRISENYDIPSED